jgi:inner membrane transporter RhtA
MSTVLREQQGPAGRTGHLTGVALMTGSAAANQLGAATAALAFPVLGPAGVVAVRQWVAGVVLLATVRPRFAAFTRRQWRPVLALAAIFATMNLSLYTAINEIGLGLAVTLEFLGPLSVALLASRLVRDLACALIAATAVVVLARPQPSTNYAGIGLALLAATCWACYILVNRVVGARVPGSQGPAAAACLSALLYVPVGIWALASHPVTTAAIGRAATAGILCSAVPMTADLLALRRVPARFFGVFMSVNPVFAALTGLVILGQPVQFTDWLAIIAIVTANAVSASAGGQAAHNRRRASRPGPATGPALVGGPGAGRLELVDRAAQLGQKRAERAAPGDRVPSAPLADPPPEAAATRGDLPRRAGLGRAPAAHAPHRRGRLQGRQTLKQLFKCTHRSYEAT